MAARPLPASPAPAADDVPAGIRLSTFRIPYHIVDSNTSGFAIGGLCEGGQIQGTVEWIVATVEGVQVGIRNGDKSLGRLLFTAAGYGRVA